MEFLKMTLWEKAFSQLETGFGFKTGLGLRGSVKAQNVYSGSCSASDLICDFFFLTAY